VTDFALLLLLAGFQVKHVLGDFVFQNAYILEHRRIWGHPGGLLHIAIHAALTLPLLLAAGVDLYMYGHVHAYEATWPISNGTVTRTLVNPPAPIHVLSGAGGPPGSPDTFNATAPAPFTRASHSGWSYGRLQVFNATHLTYTQVANADGAVVDEFTIVRQ
jgi:hypothetical protein